MSFAVLLRAVRFPSVACNRLQPATSRTAALQRRPRSSVPHVARRLCGSSVTRTMGAGGSKNGEGEEGGSAKKRSTKRSRSKREKETAAVATTAQDEVAATGKEEGAATEEYVECTVAKASEFGESE